MRRAALGLLLATITLPAAAQSTSWSGNRLVLTPLSGSPCRIALDRAYLQGSGWSASIHVVFRNRGTTPSSVTANLELVGQDQRKTSPHGPFTIPAGSVADRDIMAPFGGSLANTTLRVNITACTPAAG